LSGGGGEVGEIIGHNLSCERLKLPSAGRCRAGRRMPERMKLRRVAVARSPCAAEPPSAQPLLVTGIDLSSSSSSPQSLALSAPFCVSLLHVHPMKLTLRRALRPRPFSSMLGFLDLKTGVTLVVLFAVRPPQHEFFPLPPLTLSIRSSTRSLAFMAS